MKRRKFIQLTSITAPVISMFPAKLSAMNRDTTGKMEMRPLGRTGVKLSMLGFGGVVVMNVSTEQASAHVKRAISKGVNYFDVAPTYGNAEQMLGPALEPYRKDVFLACKTKERTKDGARKELEQSLENLKTDHFDLYQHHAVTGLDEVEQIFAPGGAMETFKAARNEGKIKYIGFSAHSVEAALAMLDSYDFDTILFPVNLTTWSAGNFGPQVLQKAHEKGMGILALKAMAKGPWPEDASEKIDKCWYEPYTDPEEALLGLRFTLSHPVTAAIPPGNEDLNQLAQDLVPRIKPLNSKEVKELKKKGLEGNPLFTYPQKS